MLHHPGKKVKLPCGFYLESNGKLSLPGLDDDWWEMNLRTKCKYKYFKPFNYRYGLKIHRLVAKYFVYNPAPDKLNYVDHIDGDTHNNNYTNLRWANAQINALNRVRAANVYLVDFD